MGRLDAVAGGSGAIPGRGRGHGKSARILGNPFPINGFGKTPWTLFNNLEAIEITALFFDGKRGFFGGFGGAGFRLY
jgi:hypothetical protein